ncbi:unnamed protein product, partial [Mesorhabditis spiculigera]
MLFRSFCLAAILYSGAIQAQSEPELEPAVRVVRFQVTYPEARVSELSGVRKFSSLLRNSVLASLRFINKHWLICGGSELDKKSTDCGKAQVTGESFGASGYKINATFIAERDPIRNAKVEATSTVLAVVQIGLKGGIFQYTNALKILGKPSQELPFEEAFFCNRGSVLVNGDRCRKLLSKRLRDSPLPLHPQTPQHSASSDDALTVEEPAIDLRGLAKF